MRGAKRDPHPARKSAPTSPFQGEVEPAARPSVIAPLLVGLLALIAATGAVRADGDAVRGEQRFLECAACHKFEPGENAVGPTLHGVFGRKAGELGDYRYSPALKRSGITWTAETLDTFIADPQKIVPANRMPYAGMPDAEARADLIAYLKKAAQ
jgi:cytochrome c2